jgi:hypothetical protein
MLQYGGLSFKINSNEIEMTNTCTIDNFLFALFVLSKLVDYNLINNFPLTSKIKQIVNFIEQKDWSNAKKYGF